jgi:Tfp pilus assembly protein PilF
VIESVSDWNWTAAEESARRGVELAPNSASAHHRLGSILLLQRRFDESETTFRRARELDPTSGSINLNVGFALFYAKRYAEACRQFEVTAELDQSFTAPKWFLARCVSELGDKRRSHQLIADALDIEGDKVLAAQVRKVSAAADDAAVMRLIVGAWEKQVSPTGITPQDMANISARLGDAESTLKWLEESVAMRHPWSVTINVSPEFDFVRDTPRFQTLLRKMNFL